jgi:hypothetical protein
MCEVYLDGKPPYVFPPIEEQARIMKEMEQPKQDELRLMPRARRELHLLTHDPELCGLDIEGIPLCSACRREDKMGSGRYVHLDFHEIVAQTEKALLVRFEDGEELWIPLSQVADPDEYHAEMGGGTISITEWLARQKGFDVEP